MGSEKDEDVGLIVLVELVIRVWVTLAEAVVFVEPMLTAFLAEAELLLLTLILVIGGIVVIEVEELEARRPPQAGVIIPGWPGEQQDKAE